MLSSHLRVPALFSLALLGWQVPALAHDTFYGGSAIGLQATAKVGDLAVKVVLGENYMSCNGAPNSQTLVSIFHPVPIGVQSKTVSTFTVGRDGVAVADAKVEDLRLTLPGMFITATVAASHSEAACNVLNQITTTGKSSLASLRINDKAYTISGSPNQKIVIPDLGTVTVNEQTRRMEGEFTSIRTVALRVKLLNTTDPVSADVAVSSSKAKIFCD